MDIVSTRCRHQLLAPRAFDRPEETVAWLGAVQAQDYPAALWAVGVRTRGATEHSVEQAIAEGRIVRTWPMRGTLHFVAAADVRWLRALLAPYAVARAARRMRELELDARTIARAGEAFARALEGGRRLTRDAMRRVLADAGIDTGGQRAYQLLWRCAQDGPICPGPRAGKQHTFVLLDEWVPGERSRRMATREEALAELATRYFRGHGPATLRDFTWWSGLPAAEARRALELAAPGLEEAIVAGERLWLLPADTPAPTRLSPHLLPAFDEYLVGYADRRAVLDPARARHVNAGGGLLGPTIALNGRIAGTWKRRLRRDAVAVEARLFAPPRPTGARALERATQAYADFLGLRPELSIAPR